MRVNASEADLIDAYLNGTNLAHANLAAADLTNANLIDAVLANTNLNLTKLNDTLFDCESLKTVNTTFNASQIHIVEFEMDGSLKEVSSCQ